METKTGGIATYVSHAICLYVVHYCLFSYLYSCAVNLYLNNNRFTGTMPEEICALRRTISVDYMNYVADHGEHIGVMDELGADCSALSCGSQELHHSEPGAYPVSCCNCCSEESHCG